MSEFIQPNPEMEKKKPELSTSEKSGLENAPFNSELIYSVGVSTAGNAEFAFLEKFPNAKVIATTLDNEGATLIAKLAEEKGFKDRLKLKLEDVSKPLPYPDNSLDYVYARLIMHYLSKQDLAQALRELHRVIKDEGKIFIVVQSANNSQATTEKVSYDEETRLTTYAQDGNQDKLLKRYFHTTNSINDAIKEAGFKPLKTEVYNETTYHDFARTTHPNNRELIEVVAQK